VGATRTSVAKPEAAVAECKGLKMALAVAGLAGARTESSVVSQVTQVAVKRAAKAAAAIAMAARAAAARAAARAAAARAGVAREGWWAG